MDEYRIDIKVRNNLILSAIEKAGYETVSAFCRANGMRPQQLTGFITLKEAPLNKDGTFSSRAQKLMDALCALPEDLWTQDQMYAALKSNKRSMTMDETRMELLMYGENHETPKLPEDLIHEKEVSKLVGEVLNTLTPRQAKVLRLRNGMEDNSEGMTLEEVADKFDVTRERARQIEIKALKDMRHPSRYNALKQIIKDMYD
jgi:RNA polymerase sigma factor (sigma-70 family)